MTLCGESEYKSPAFPSLTVCASSNCFIAAQTARRSVSFAVSPTGFASASFALACAHDFGVDGSGLGLAIVREIAQQHGVEVILEDANLKHRPGLSDQGGVAFGPGARFTLRFKAES